MGYAPLHPSLHWLSAPAVLVALVGWVERSVTHREMNCHDYEAGVVAFTG